PQYLEQVLLSYRMISKRFLRTPPFHNWGSWSPLSEQVHQVLRCFIYSPMLFSRHASSSVQGQLFMSCIRRSVSRMFISMCRTYETWVVSGRNFRLHSLLPSSAEHHWQGFHCSLDFCQRKQFLRRLMYGRETRSMADGSYLLWHL